MELGFTSDLAKARNLFYKINMRGTTPTGPALLETIRYMAGKPAASPMEDKDGCLSEYIV
jgi:Ca-activated chloride channel family protein